jgi:hypothetical protein
MPVGKVNSNPGFLVWFVVENIDGCPVLVPVVIGGKSLRLQPNTFSLAGRIFSLGVRVAGGPIPYCAGR